MSYLRNFKKNGNFLLLTSKNKFRLKHELVTLNIYMYDDLFARNYFYGILIPLIPYQAVVPKCLGISL